MARNINPDATRAANPPSAVAATSKSDDTGRFPDYKCDSYRAMQPTWILCEDAKEGTDAYRRKSPTYLPRMKSESPTDYAARVAMTFASDHYATTLDDLEGLAFTEDPTVAESVPTPVRALLENIDGRGAAFPVLARRAFRESVDDGHVILYSDYPAVSDPARLTLADVKARKIRPYVSVRTAQDVLSWRTETIGGEEVLVQCVFRECVKVPMGIYGTTDEARYRVLRQEVEHEPDPVTGDPVAVGLGAMSWEVWKKVEKSASGKKLSDDDAWTMLGTGAIEGPERLPVRVAFGGDQLGVMHSRPFLSSLAYTQLEEVQVKSEYANIMHKCNVPTPIFVGRPLKQQGQAVVMGEGIDVPIGGSATMLEPSGAAIGATRQRLEDLRLEARRKGATLNSILDNGKTTATEAAINARQRNARLAISIQSHKDAWEGVMADLAAFLGVSMPENATGAKGGGSIVFRTDFGAAGYDAAFVDQCRQAWDAGALPLDAYLTVLKTGKLPDDFDPEEVAALQEAAVQAQRDAAAAQASLDAGGNAGDGSSSGNDAGGGDPPSDGPPVKGKGKTSAKGKTPSSGQLPGDKAGKRAAKQSAGV